MFKFSIFPCHFWIDSFYEGSSLIIVIFFSVIYKLAIVCFYFKIFFFLFIKFDNFFFYFIIFSIAYGAHLAFIQKKIKRYWAFSTVNNFGFFFFTTIFCNYFWGLQIGLFFIIIYFIMTFFFFNSIFYKEFINWKFNILYFSIFIFKK
jgi:NADH:ubiquinone oxidoreductase subunit 2 (subunit N)